MVRSNCSVGGNKNLNLLKPADCLISSKKNFLLKNSLYES